MAIVLLDLDGTVYAGKKLISGVKEKIDSLRAEGHTVLIVSNNSTRNREDIKNKLLRFGLDFDVEDIYSAGWALAKYLEENHSNKTVYYVGEASLRKEFEWAGLQLVDTDPDVLALGLDRSISYDLFVSVLHAVKEDTMLFAANGDSTYPTSEGLKPGAGTFVAAFEKMLSRNAQILGKPECYLGDIILSKYNAKRDEIIMVGDRLDTDILFAKNCGFKSVLVLSGIVKKIEGNVKPDSIIPSLKELDVSLL